MTVAPPVQAIIFDMDGLLVDSEPLWEAARRDYCSSIGCDWTMADEATVKGNNSLEWAERIRVRCGPVTNLHVIVDEICGRMEVRYTERLPLLPGAVAAVTELSNTWPLALASSSPRHLIEHVLREAGIRERFRILVSSDDVGRGKPDPAVFLEAARRLEHVPTAIAVFEDSSAGINAAHAARMRVIVVPNVHNPPTQPALALASVVLHSLTEFHPRILDNLPVV